MDTDAPSHNPILVAPLEDIRPAHRALLLTLPVDLVSHIREVLGATVRTDGDTELLERMLRVRAAELTIEEAEWLAEQSGVRKDQVLATFLDHNSESFDMSTTGKALLNNSEFSIELESMEGRTKAHAENSRAVPPGVWKLASYLIWADIIANL
jgi:hypothetical protein